MFQRNNNQLATNHGSRMPRFVSGRNNNNDRASQTVIQRNSCLPKIYKSTLRIASWNARSMKEPGKFRNIQEEMIRLRIGIPVLSDTKWASSRRSIDTMDEFNTLEAATTNSRYGVGINLSENKARSVTGFAPISKRNLMWQ